MVPYEETPSKKVLALLKQSGGGLSVKDLCEKLDLSSMAVRRQLILLEGKNLVSSHKNKQKVGRPTNSYFLTDQGHEEFHRDYANLAVDLLVSLRSLDGKEKLNEVFETRKQEYLQRYRQKILGKTLEARVHQMTQLLTQDGYMASWERLAPNKYLIKEMNCSVAQVAERFPHLRIYEEELLSELLQAKVTRKHHLLHKDHFCSYLVEG